MTPLRFEHPEWMLGDSVPPWFAASWNFAVPEIRQQRYEHVVELCSMYDWDGVELDWQRHGFYFPTDDAHRLRYLLTDLQRAIRQATNEIARRRGRPFYVATRVSGSLQGCQNIGFDVEEWVREGLLDILIGAGGAWTDPAVDVPAFLAVTRGTGIRVYPGFDSNLPGEYRGLEPEPWWHNATIRAAAARYHAQGADGIYLFNWHAARDTRRPLMTQFGDPARLVGATKVYHATCRYITHTGEWADAGVNDRIRGEVPVKLMPTLTGDGPSVSLEVADDLSAPGSAAPSRLELRLGLKEWTPVDRLVVRWDRVELGDPAVRSREGDDPLNPSDMPLEVAWLVFTLKPDQVARGRHEVQVALAKRNPQLLADLEMTDLELHVVFPDPPSS